MDDLDRKIERFNRRTIIQSETSVVREETMTGTATLVNRNRLISAFRCSLQKPPRKVESEVMYI